MGCPGGGGSHSTYTLYKAILAILLLLHGVLDEDAGIESALVGAGLKVGRILLEDAAILVQPTIAV